LTGTAEFYIKPEGDSRTWHIINRYLSPSDYGNKEYNNAEYVFSRDSVTVLNEFIEIPDEKKFGLDLTGIKF
jgi:hypothetical protein